MSGKGSKYTILEDITKQIDELKARKKRLADRRRLNYLVKYLNKGNKELVLDAEIGRLRAARAYRIKKKETLKKSMETKTIKKDKHNKIFITCYSFIITFDEDKTQFSLHATADN